MSDGSWKQVLEDYKYAQTQSWGEDHVWMEKLVSHLLENRDLSLLYPITSHFQRLIVFIGTSFNEKYKKPKILIQLNHSFREHFKDKYRYKFSLISTVKAEELFRENVESVFCSFEKSLEVFDEMFEKLKAVTK